MNWLSRSLIALPLELQARFTGRIRQLLDHTVVMEAGSVEHHRGNPIVLGALRDRLADSAASRLVPKVLERLAQVLVDGGGSNQGYPLHIVNELGVHVGQRPKDHKAGPLRGPGHHLANAQMDAMTPLLPVPDLSHGATLLSSRP